MGLLKIVFCAGALLAPVLLGKALHAAGDEAGGGHILQVQDDSAATKKNDLSRDQRPGRTGRPLPRFVSLRANKVNLRTGPGARYPIDWVYQRAGLPVEIIDEFDTWRRIRDWQGTIGWVHQSMLQGRRTVMIMDERRLMRRRPDAQAPGVAYLEPGAIAALESCEGLWCEISAGGFRGWLETGSFYGLYASELLP